MLISRRALCAIAAAWACGSGNPAAIAAQQHAAPRAGIGAVFAAGVPVSIDARDVVRWILDSSDNGGMPLAIVDKKDADVLVFSRRGRFVGATPVLLGMARGDHSVTGVGDLPPSRIPPAARTTPAGCVVVPVAFYEGVVGPLLGKGHGVVYALPETRPLQEVFAGADDAQTANRP